MAFAQFDTSGDDKLDYREFCEMIKHKEAQAKWDAMLQTLIKCSIYVILDVVTFHWKWKPE